MTVVLRASTTATGLVAGLWGHAVVACAREFSKNKTAKMLPAAHLQEMAQLLQKYPASQFVIMGFPW